MLHSVYAFIHEQSAGDLPKHIRSASMHRSLTQQVTLAAACFIGGLLIALVVIIRWNQTIRAATTHLTAHAVRRSQLLADLDSALEAVFTNAEFFIRGRQVAELDAAQEAVGMAKAALADL